jgi:hypothetical protein
MFGKADTIRMTMTTTTTTTTLMLTFLPNVMNLVRDSCHNESEQVAEIRCKHVPTGEYKK